MLSVQIVTRPGPLHAALSMALILAGAASSSAQSSPAPESTPRVATPTARTSRQMALGLRLGYAQPSGSAWQGVSQDALTEGVVRLQGDVNYRLSSMLVGGAYGALGLGSNGDQVDAGCEGSGRSCTVITLDLGFQTELRPLAGAALDPWLGLSAGLDLLSQHVDYGSYSESVNLYGPALAASAGLDVDFGAFVLGPYASYQLGWYTSLDVSGATYSNDDAELRDKAMHRWLMLGVRGSYGFGG